MIKNIISEIEEKIRVETISAEGRKELLQQLTALKSKVAALERKQAANVRTHAALKKSTEELRSSISGFEQSHPKLVHAVNSISNTLSNIGI